MIQEKITLAAFSLASTVLLAEIPINMMFPENIFSFPACIYGFIANVIYTVLEIYKRQKKFVEHVEGIEPFSKNELLLKLLRPFIAGFLNGVIFAGFSAYIITNPNGFGVDKISFIKQREGIILLGLIIGFGFEYFTSEETIKLFSNFLKTTLKNGLKNILTKLS